MDMLLFDDGPVLSTDSQHCDSTKQISRNTDYTEDP